MEHDILNKAGKVIGKVELNPDVFDGRVSMEVLYQAVNSYKANKTSMRMASTKNRAEVQGSGKKPWRQKGTGRARVGELRNPLWRKGGVVFGPRVRHVYRKVPKGLRLSALKSALNAKYGDKELVIMDKLDIEAPKTKTFAAVLKNLKLVKRSLFVDKVFSENLLLSSRNLQEVSLARADDLNAYLALDCKNLVITKDALSILEGRILSKPSRRKADKVSLKADKVPPKAKRVSPKPKRVSPLPAGRQAKAMKKKVKDEK
ncbi:50S ribosomal protein L4 [Candidatus Omnitrophota bacterium]